MGKRAKSKNGSSSAGPSTSRRCSSEVKDAVPKANTEATVEEQVFSNDELRERIVGQVIRNEIFELLDDFGIAPANGLRSVRLVAKSWFLAATKYLLESDMPLIKLDLSPFKNRTGLGKAQLNRGRLLLEFTETMIMSSRVMGVVPQFSLKTFPWFFHEENTQKFSLFLETCGSGLVELDLQIPKSPTMNFQFPGVNIRLPELHTLTLTFPNKQFEMEGEEIGDPLLFIQSVLSGAPKLEKLRFWKPPVSNLTSQSSIPPGIRNLNLPPTITRLGIDSFMASSELEALLNYDLPSLQDLSFGIANATYKTGLVTQILEKFRTSLQKLTINDPLKPYSAWNPHTPTLFRFPVMEKLEEFTLFNKYAELEGGQHLSPKNLFPNLKKLTLFEQNPVKLQKWVESSSFPKVTELPLSPICHSGQLRSLPLSSNFPSLSSLDLNFTELEATFDLDQIFLQMSHLDKLDVTMRRECNSYGNIEHWDSLLTGIPVGMATELRGNPDFCENFQVKSENLPSIVNLKELTCLCLRSSSSRNGESLFSDLVFHFGFLKMPKLKKLVLSGGFKASDKMTRVWTECHRGVIDKY